MGLFDFPHVDILAFLIIFVRITAMVAWFPVFGDKNTPVPMKILFSFLLTLIIYPIINGYISRPLPDNSVALIILVVHEVTIGLLIGLIARFIFYAVSLASQLMSFQMGFGMVSLIDPNTSGRVSVINQFQMVVATLLFFIVNGHYLFFEALINSYQQVWPGALVISQDFLREMILASSTVFVVGFKIAAPVAVVLLVTNAGLGVLARAVPQMNVFMVSFPLTIGVGFIVLGLSVPLFVTLLGSEYQEIGNNIFKILKTI